MNFPLLYKIRFYYSVQKTMKVPFFIGPAIRGILGYALKESHPETFGLFFSKSEEGGGLKPYAIAVGPNPNTVFFPGDTFFFDLFLFGGQRGKIDLDIFKKFEHYTLIKNTKPLKYVKAVSVFGTGSRDITSLEDAVPYNFPRSGFDSEKLEVRFVSPVCIKKIESPKDLSFERFSRLLYERLSGLFPEFSSNELRPDLSAALDVRLSSENLIRNNVKHYSDIRKSFVFYKPAFIGSLVFEGDFRAFSDILKIGEQIGIGRGTTSGLGRFKLSPL